MRSGANKVESVALPRIGEVVYQGLPLAAVTIAGQAQCIIPSPASGVVIEINESLASDPAALLSDPCGKGWIACVSPTRREEEAKCLASRKVVLLSRDQASAQTYADKLRWLGCDVRSIAAATELDALRKTLDSQVVLFDAASFGGEGPGIVGEINAKDPSLKIIILAPSDGVAESAYRIRRIFYYAVEPLVDNEIADVIAAAFQPVTHAASPTQHRATPRPLSGVSITNHNGKRVRLLASPGLLYHDEGLGQLLRQKLLQLRFPLESSPEEIQITPMNLLSLANRCDRLIVLMAQDIGRLPGSVKRDTKAEYVALVGPGADKAATFLVQPPASPETPLAFEPSVLDALAEFLANEMITA